MNFPIFFGIFYYFSYFFLKASIMPVPGDNSPVSIRKYFHGDINRPFGRNNQPNPFSNSDIDLFIYGLSAKEATEKVKKIQGKFQNKLYFEDFLYFFFFSFLFLLIFLIFLKFSRNQENLQKILRKFLR